MLKTAASGREVINERYAVTCAEGVAAVGAKVVTRIAGDGTRIYLPLVLRNAR